MTAQKFFRAASAAKGAATLTALALALTGCSPTSTAEPAHKPSGRLNIVTSVAVWADVAQAIGGKYVTATAILAHPYQDPHSYEATVRDQLAVNNAQLTIANGLGYDVFFSKLVAQKPKCSSCSQLTLGNHVSQPGPNPNPHLWFDFEYTLSLIPVIARAEENAVTGPAAKSAIAAGAAAYEHKVQALIAQQQAQYPQTQFKTYLISESFATRLLKRSRMLDLTPFGFKQASEQDQDASPVDMAAIKNMLTTHKVKLVVENQQTVTSQTTQIAGWAKAAKIAVLNLSEVLPSHNTYLTWMKSNLNKITASVK